MEAPATSAVGFTAPPAVSAKAARPSPPTTLAACYNSDGSKSSNASPVRVGANAPRESQRGLNWSATSKEAGQMSAESSPAPPARSSTESCRMSGAEAPVQAAAPPWRGDLLRVGAGQRLEPRDDLAAFSCAWEAVKEAGRDYERQQAAEALRAREAAEALELPSLREARWEHSDVGVTQAAHEESHAASPPPRPAAAAVAEASASGGAARPLRRVTGFFRACWAHVRAAPPQRDDPVAARAAAAPTEDLLGSLAVTDMAELAWRQSAYVAHRRAEGYSEGHARAMWMTESYELNAPPHWVKPMMPVLATDPIAEGLDMGWFYGMLGRPEASPLH